MPPKPRVKVSLNKAQLESGNPNGIRPELKYLSSNLIMLHKYYLVDAHAQCVEMNLLLLG